ncbi:MAG: SpoIIE family protein phosphatase [Planctomycetota bacterium]
MDLWTKRLSIRWIAPITIGGLVILVAGVLGLVAYVQGQNAAQELIDTSLRKVRSRVEGELDGLLDLPPRINRINVRLLDKGALDPDDLRAWRETLFVICDSFERLSSICWGDTKGRATWIARYPGNDRYDYAIKDDETGDYIEEFLFDEKGRIGGVPKGIYKYDPRVRPWYTTCLESGKPTWSEPFGWVHQDGSLVTLGLSYAQPYRDADGNLVGVIDAELSLHDVSSFLESMPPSVSGLSFVTDHRGRLIATSAGIPVADDKLNPLPATAAEDARIAEAARAIGETGELQLQKRVRFELHGKPYLVEIAPYRHYTGIHWQVASVVPMEDFLGPVQEANARVLAIGIGASLIAILAGVLLGFRFAAPIRALVRHARRIGEGDLKSRIRLDQTSEFVQLTGAMNEMAEDLEDRMKLRESLALAMEVQQSLLPSEDPDAYQLQVAGHSKYCDETGGDYYDFLDVSGNADHTLTVAVGDVMGHGIAAAMLMATARGILHSRTKTPGRLCELLTHMNAILVRDTAGERFMTMQLCTIDADLRRMRWASAGAGAPLMYDPSTDRFPTFGRGGLPLGLMEAVTYKERVVDDLAPGTILFPSTDGVWETRNPEGEEYGLDRLQQLIRTHAHESAEELRRRIRSAVEAWRGGKGQDDDITFVVIKLLGVEEEPVTAGGTARPRSR